jgi:hypothetical protein
MLLGFPIVVALYFLLNSLLEALILFVVIAFPLMLFADLIIGRKVRRLITAKERLPIRLLLFQNLLHGFCIYSAPAFLVAYAFLKL